MIINRNQSAFHHRLQLRRRQILAREKIQYCVLLVRLYAHHKAVGRIHWQLALPALQKVTAHQRQHQQSHTPQTERHHLHRHAAAVARQIIERLREHPAYISAHDVRQTVQQQPRQTTCHQQPCQQAAQHGKTQP